jgi:hypothetical protein
MGCKFPEHHGGGGFDTGTGGSWWPLGVAVAAAALFAPVIGVFIHVLSLVLTFVGIAAIASGGGWLWWRLKHGRPQVAYRPQMTPVQSRWGRPVLPRDTPAAVGQGGQHLHINLAGASPEAVAEAMRQIRGGHQ